MTGHRIKLPGFRADRHGKIVLNERRLNVCTRLKRRNSKRVRVKRKISEW